ncbi:MAG TPA: urate hydroxylase PuuD [Gaiellaceae bacterium]|nr:urate hydroxylase PuuD [Gaiellaceae bacterium]
MSGALGVLALAAYWRDWLDLLLRWLHVIAAIAWIGTSFYFVLLDQSLRLPKKREDSEAGVGGELWEVHGGGFYHVQKYQVAPPALPDHLAWFKWEAYTTWLSGFGLLVVLFYLDAHANLIDPTVADLSTWEAIAISVGLLAAAWIVYDLLCRLLPHREVVLGACILVLTGIAAWGTSQLFAQRAAFLQVGAMLGTIMAANVLFVIIPAHWELIHAKEDGREPDAAPAIAAKQRSVHNNYLTLPVLLTMLAGHFSVLYTAGRPWLVLVGLMVLGAWIRLFYNLRHAGRTHWWMPVVAAAAVVAIAVAIKPSGDSASATAGDASAGKAVFTSAGCTACHTLDDAGANGTVGPNLDAVKPSAALVVERVTNGEGGMPSFKAKLSETQIQDVAAYVSSVAGK